MYIKKSVLIACSILLVVATFLGTIMLVNPFGALQFDDFFKFGTGINTLKKYYYQDIDGDKLLDGILLGASFSTEDPYTVYMDKESADSFLESVESDDYTGVGLYISNEDGFVTVVSPLSGSPAEKAGIATGDKILEVDGETVSGEFIDEAATKMKGKENTEVKLKVLKKATEQETELTLTRKTIKRETVNSKLLEKNIGYIQITQFGVNTYDEFINHFNTLAKDGMHSLVIDLRNNPGGYVEVAVEIIDCFVDEGEIVYTLDKYGNKRDYMATEGASEVPMRILTNNGSASASEIFVGAMKDYGLAKSIGEKTFGKGVTQITQGFYDGSLLKITDSRYYTPNGICIDKTGIEPDVEIKMSDDSYSRISELSLDEDIQLKYAVEELSQNKK